MPHGKRQINKLAHRYGGVNKKDKTPKPVKLEQIIEKQIKNEIVKVKQEQTWQKSTISE